MIMKEMLSDLDLAEQAMGSRIRQMEAGELVDYCKIWFKHLHGHLMPYRAQEHKHLFVKFRKDYGPDAGLILKFIFLHMGGKKGDDLFSPVWLSSKWRWWMDKMLSQAKAQQRKERQVFLSRDNDDSSGFSTLADLKKAMANKG